MGRWDQGWHESWEIESISFMPLLQHKQFFVPPSKKGTFFIHFNIKHQLTMIILECSHIPLNALTSWDLLSHFSSPVFFCGLKVLYHFCVCFIHFLLLTIGIRGHPQLKCSYKCMLIFIYLQSWIRYCQITIYRFQAQETYCKNWHDRGPI